MTLYKYNRCEEIATVSEVFSSFKLTVPASDRDTLLNPDLWPEGILVKKYINFKKKISVDRSDPNPLNTIETMINVISYNCQSFNKNIDLINMISDQCDILLLQETLIPDHSLNLYEKLQNFDYVATPSTRDPSCFYGRSSAGLLVAWRRELT